MVPSKATRPSGQPLPPEPVSPPPGCPADVHFTVQGDFRMIKVVCQKRPRPALASSTSTQPRSNRAEHDDEGLSPIALAHEGTPTRSQQLPPSPLSLQLQVHLLFATATEVQCGWGHFSVPICALELIREFRCSGQRAVMRLRLKARKLRSRGMTHAADGAFNAAPAQRAHAVIDLRRLKEQGCGTARAPLRLQACQRHAVFGSFSLLTWPVSSCRMAALTAARARKVSATPGVTIMSRYLQDRG